MLQVPDVAINFSADNTAARVASGNIYNSLFLSLATIVNMKKTATFEGRSEQGEYKWSGGKIAGVIMHTIG